MPSVNPAPAGEDPAISPGHARLPHPLGLLVALLPATMALATWTPDAHLTAGLAWMRFTAPPVLLAELLVTVAAMTAGFRPAETVRALPGRAGLALAALAAIMIGTTIFAAPDRPMALLRTAISLNHLMFGFAVAHLIRVGRIETGPRLLTTLITGSTLYGLLMIVYVAAIPDVTRFDWSHFGLGVINIRHASFYIAPGLALLLGLVATGAYAPRRTMAASLLAAFMFAIFFWSGSRGRCSRPWRASSSPRCCFRRSIADASPP